MYFIVQRDGGAACWLMRRRRLFIYEKNLTKIVIGYSFTHFSSLSALIYVSGTVIVSNWRHLVLWKCFILRIS